MDSPFANSLSRIGHGNAPRGSLLIHGRDASAGLAVPHLQQALVITVPLSSYLHRVVSGCRGDVLRVPGHVEIPDDTIVSLVRTDALAVLRVPNARCLKTQHFVLLGASFLTMTIHDTFGYVFHSESSEMK